jgi:hypothetical protein
MKDKVGISGAARPSLRPIWRRARRICATRMAMQRRRNSGGRDGA